MTCDACTGMQESPDPTGHDGLVEARNPVRMRRLGRPAVMVRHYRCGHCGTRWLSESDPLGPGKVEWVCLHHSSNVLFPVSALNPGAAHASKQGAAGGASATSNTPPRHKFS
ncbi:hypothetical protein [Paraburkholderia acidipaludis]|uniref:hypothetical protein n=1 Tax=Paraburkholderia acidipaludis TaxID=660537 RepID=UPI0012EC76A2|nr:hypothetical protein [Paraburkholderia acidipaludis]